MSQIWEFSKKVDLTGSGGAAPSVDIELPIDIPIFNPTVWAISDAVLADIDVSVMLAGPAAANAIILNGVALVNFTATRAADIVWSDANPITLPRSGILHPKKDTGIDPFKVIVRCTNGDAAAASLSIYAAGMAL